MSTTVEEVGRAPLHYISGDKFRYKVLKGPWFDVGSFVQALNKFGDRGWEAFQITERNNAPHLVYLKMMVDETYAPETTNEED